MFVRMLQRHAFPTYLPKHFFLFSLADFMYYRLSRERSASKVSEPKVTLSVFAGVCCVHILFIHVRAVCLHNFVSVSNRRLLTCLIQVSLVFTERATRTPQNHSYITNWFPVRDLHIHYISVVATHQ